MKNIVNKFSPECVVAENLIDLIGDGEADSDASVVIGDFAKMQYQADKYIVSAVDYGSKTVKKRLFSIALRGIGESNSRKLIVVRQLLDGFRIDHAKNKLRKRKVKADRKFDQELRSFVLPSLRLSEPL